MPQSPQTNQDIICRLRRLLDDNLARVDEVLHQAEDLDGRIGKLDNVFERFCTTLLFEILSVEARLIAKEVLLNSEWLLISTNQDYHKDGMRLTVNCELGGRIRRFEWDQKTYSHENFDLSTEDETCPFCLPFGVALPVATPLVAVGPNIFPIISGSETYNDSLVDGRKVKIKEYDEIWQVRSFRCCGRPTLQVL